MSSKRNINHADLQGLLTIVAGPLVGLAASKGHGIPAVVGFALGGFCLGIFSAKVAGNYAYLALNREIHSLRLKRSFAAIAYLLAYMAIPMVGMAVTVTVPILFAFVLFDCS
jgi:hypothetical protein